MANTENFPNSGKKKTRHRRFDRCYAELLHLLTKHRFRFSVEPLNEPVKFEDQYHPIITSRYTNGTKYPTYNLDTRITIDDGTRKKKIVVYIAPNIDALIDPDGGPTAIMDGQEVTVWAYTELRRQEVEYGTL